MAQKIVRLDDESRANREVMEYLMTVIVPSIRQLEQRIDKIGQTVEVNLRKTSDQLMSVNDDMRIIISAGNKRLSDGIDGITSSIHEGERDLRQLWSQVHSTDNRISSIDHRMETMSNILRGIDHVVRPYWWCKYEDDDKGSSWWAGLGMVLYILFLGFTIYCTHQYFVQ